MTEPCALPRGKKGCRTAGLQQTQAGTPLSGEPICRPIAEETCAGVGKHLNGLDGDPRGREIRNRGASKRMPLCFHEPCQSQNDHQSTAQHNWAGLGRNWDKKGIKKVAADGYRPQRLGARGGSRTRTPLRALAPEASESTNSTTRASGCAASLSARVIIPSGSGFVNTFLCLTKKFIPIIIHCVTCGCAGTGRLASLRC